LDSFLLVRVGEWLQARIQMGPQRIYKKADTEERFYDTDAKWSSTPSLLLMCNVHWINNTSA